MSSCSGDGRHGSMSTRQAENKIYQAVGTRSRVARRGRRSRVPRRTVRNRMVPISVFMGTLATDDRDKELTTIWEFMILREFCMWVGHYPFCLSIFFFTCLFFLRIAGVAQAIMLWHMLLFGDAFGPAYAIFWCFCIQLCFWGGGQTSKNAFNRQLRYFMVVSGVHSSVVFNPCV